MNIKEYNKIKKYTYNEYCDYLKNKYGEVRLSYFTEDWIKRRNISRTKDGLIIHHIKEDTTVMLSDLEFAKKQPYEYQRPWNLVYCNYLEYLLLHILIIEKNITNRDTNIEVGVGGIIYFIVPELNDWYSGFEISQSWKRDCYNLVKNHESVYLVLIKRYLTFVKNNLDNMTLPEKLLLYNPGKLKSSFNQRFGLRNDEENKYIYNKIQILIKEIYKDKMGSLAAGE